MAFTVQAAFGEVTVTISSSGEYDGMTAEDMANICRRTLLRADADITLDLDDAKALDDGQDS